MNGSMDVDDLLDAVSKMLLWCFVLCVGLILLWFGMLACCGDFVYRMHGLFFDMPRSSFDLIHYCGMTLTKLCAFVFALFPYVGIRLVLRARKRRSAQ